MVEFYLVTFPRFPLRKKEHKSYFFGKNRTHDFRTSRCAGYLLDHSGDEGYYLLAINRLQFWLLSVRASFASRREFFSVKAKTQESSWDTPRRPNLSDANSPYLL